MARKLRTSVHVHNDDGTTTVYGPEDDIPAADAKKIGDHAFLDEGEQPVVDGPVGVVPGAAPTAKKKK